MAWTYLAELEESASHLENGSIPSPIAKSTPIVKQCFYREWLREIWSKRQFGMIFGASTLTFSKEQLISFSQDFHAKTSALQALEKAWKESEADYFTRSSGLLARLS